RSSITEVSLHGINTSRKAKSVTHVSGTKRHLSLKSDTTPILLKSSLNGSLAAMPTGNAA
ncbi:MULTISPECIES: hypothetical protein, partial [Agrobacterium]|uniref:hypothetical protein n=1 Tax=Agrobacterium TaxID=357 RepID=UPI001959168A